MPGMEFIVSLPCLDQVLKAGEIDPLVQQMRSLLR